MRSPRESGSPFSPRAERGARMGARDPLPLGRQRRAVAMELLVPGMRTRCAPSPQAGAVRGTASGGGEGGPGSIGSCRGCACPCGKAAAGEARRLLARALLRGSAVRAPPPPALPRHLQAGLSVSLRMPGGFWKCPTIKGHARPA